jgi:hypothetical protein
MKSIVLVVAVLALDSVAQSSGASQNVPPPDLQGFPAAQAPDGLAAVPLPDSISAVTAVFERLPNQVAGHTRAPQLDRMPPDRVLVGYGEDRRIGDIRTPLLRLQAVDIAKGDFYPTNWTGGQVVAYLARQRKDAIDAGQDGDLFWIRSETPMNTVGSSDSVLYGIVWGRLDSSWMFSVQADTPEHRNAVVTAFVEAAQIAVRE